MSESSEALIARVQDLLAPLGEISVRRMFGGHGVYCDERMLALLESSPDTAAPAMPCGIQPIPQREADRAPLP